VIGSIVLQRQPVGNAILCDEVPRRSAFENTFLWCVLAFETSSLFLQISRMTNASSFELFPSKISRHGNDQIEIEWSDAHKRMYGIRQLRDACPCATCRELRMSPRPTNLLTILKAEEIAPLLIVGMNPVGRYAYSIEFSDGHSSGIYTLDYLRELGRETPV